MGVIIMLALIYVAGIIGVAIMKKLQPWNNIYPVWVAVVCVVFTLTVIAHVFLG